MLIHYLTLESLELIAIALALLMPVGLKGPLLATFIKPHCPLIRPNLSRPLRFPLYPPYQTFIHLGLTCVIPHRQIKRSFIISQYRSVRYQVSSPQYNTVKPRYIQVRNIPIQKRAFKLNYISSKLSRTGLSFPHRSLASWQAVLFIGIIAGAVILQLHYRNSSSKQSKSQVEPSVYLDSKRPSLDLVGENWSDMTGAELPGRPGNLTPEQEEKLREIWVATLQVFGVLEARRAKDANENGKSTPFVGSNPTTEALISEKPKKKRLTLFGRKQKDSETESVASPEPASPSMFPLSPSLLPDSDDKYGQTKQFHDTLAQQTPESLRAAFWSMVKHDHPDGLLLRFLRARKWDVEKALVMMVSTMHWRSKDMHVDDDIMRSGEEAALLASQSSNQVTRKSGEDFLAQMRMGKSFLHGTDKSERPMCFVRVRLHKQGEQTEESLERYTVFVIESARMILAPPVDTACVVFDMTGFSLANMDYSPVKFMIKCFEANYPESLGVVLVHKAPWVFQGIWKIIRGWLDPVVASKVHFTNNVDELVQFIPKSQIPKDIGGDENWSYHYVEPAANENDLMKDMVTRDRLLAERESIVKDYESATIKWIDHKTPSEAMEIKANLKKLVVDLERNYWKLDPYIRARSLYDRIGMIQRGGKICFYPTSQAETVTSTSNGMPKVEHSPDDVD